MPVSSPTSLTGRAPRADLLAAGAVWVVCMALGLALYRISHVPEIGYYHLNDDQMITMRVAWMIAVEGVPYYNPGEAVAANTSLFWPFALSLLFKAGLGLEEAVAALFVLSTAAYCALSVWVAWQIGDWFGRAACVVLLVISAPALNYAGSGWEHVPQTVFVTLGCVALIRGTSLRHWLIAFYAFALGFAVRPDVAVVIALLFLAAVVLLKGRDRRAFVLWSLPAIVFPAAYLWGMLAFYGDVVPNTWYLKRPEGEGTLVSGLTYLIDSRQSGPVPVLWLIGLMFWRRHAAGTQVVLGAIALQMAYIVWIGGDAFRAGRFLLLFFPVAALIVVSQMAAMQRGKLALAAACLIGVMAIYDNNDRLVRWTREHLVSQIRLTALIREAVPAEAGSVGLHTLGVGYHLPDHHIVDFLGKADPVVAKSSRRWGFIAHDKWDYDHSFGANRIAAIPVHHATYRRVERDPRRDYETPADTYMAPMAAHAIRTGAYTYLSPETLCTPGSFGLLVFHDLADETVAAGCNTGG